MKDYLADFPLEFCALRFLIQWLRREEALFEAISATPTNDDIREALAYFQVSRNFKGLQDEPQKASLIRKALLRVRNSPSLTAEQKVEHLALDLKRYFKQFNLSAATKLLWLSHKRPYVIYDKRAVTALSKKFKHKFSARSYVKYAQAWHTRYAEVGPAINSAVRELPKGRAFMPKCRLTDESLVRLVTKEWFKERVFDIFLWEVGGNG
jgi:hypothetical protein